MLTSISLFFSPDLLAEIFNWMRINKDREREILWEKKNAVSKTEHEKERNTKNIESREIIVLSALRLTIIRFNIVLRKLFITIQKYNAITLFRETRTLFHSNKVFGWTHVVMGLCALLLFLFCLYLLCRNNTYSLICLVLMSAFHDDYMKKKLFKQKKKKTKQNLTDQVSWQTLTGFDIRFWKKFDQAFRLPLELGVFCHFWYKKYNE